MDLKAIAVLYFLFGYLTCISLFLTGIIYLQFGAITYSLYLTFQLVESQTHSNDEIN